MGWKVPHKRIKQTPCKRTMAMHVARVGQMPCLVTGAPACVHHVMHCTGKYTRRDDRFIVPLSPQMHNDGNLSVHGLGSEEKFLKVHGVDLVAHAQRLWAETERLADV